jgi:hypothetical protein
MPNFFPQFFALFEQQSNNYDNINWRADIVFKKKENIIWKSFNFGRVKTIKIYAKGKDYHHVSRSYQLDDLKMNNFCVEDILPFSSITLELIVSLLAALFHNNFQNPKGKVQDQKDKKCKQVYVQSFGMLIDVLERDFANANADAHLFPSWNEIK